MAEHLLEREILPTGVVEEIYYDDIDDKLISHSILPVNQILDNLYRKRNDGTNGFSKSRDFRHIGEIPLTEYAKLAETHKFLPGSPEEMKYIRMWLKENTLFKAVDGKI